MIDPYNFPDWTITLLGLLRNISTNTTHILLLKGKSYFDILAWLMLQNCNLEVVIFP